MSEESYQNAPPPYSVTDPLEEPSWWQKPRVKQFLYGLVISICIAISWTGATQFTKSSLVNKNFYGPFFMVWFNTSWMIICFPVYLIGIEILISFKSIPPRTISQIFKESSLIFGPNGLTIVGLLTRCFPFLFCWLVANYAYSQSLGHISPGETSAIFSSNLAIVYILSLLFLKDKVVFAKVFSVVLATGGIVLMAYGQGFSGAAFLGVLMAILSSVSAAVYKVGFKRIFGEATIGQVSLMMTSLGASNVLLVWPIMLALALTGAEMVEWSWIPWALIGAGGALNLIFNFLVNFGIAITHPLFISVGMFLGMPLNAIIDAIWRDVSMDSFSIAGSVCILLSFILMLLPDSVGNAPLKLCCPSHVHGPSQEND